jgi:hypothetical protein
MKTTESERPMNKGIPQVRSNTGGIAWTPDPRTCRSWAIEGGGTLTARDAKGRLVGAYRLKAGETVETA